MTALSITHYPNYSSEIPFFGKVTVDINEAVISKMPKGATLTNKLALEIFETIRNESELISFALKPLSLFTLSVITLGASMITLLSCTAFACPLIIATLCVTLYVLSGLVLGFSGATIVFGEDFLSETASAYGDQSCMASSYINKIKKAQERGEELSYDFSGTTAPSAMQDQSARAVDLSSKV